MQEAVLIYAGVVSDLPPSGNKRFVIDIGGGSTELIVGAGNQRLITHSLPVGCVSWRDRYFSDQESVNSAELDRKLSLASKAAKSVFQSVAPGVNHYNLIQLIGKPAFPGQPSIGTFARKTSPRQVRQTNRSGSPS